MVASIIIALALGAALGSAAPQGFNATTVKPSLLSTGSSVVISSATSTSVTSQPATLPVIYDNFNTTESQCYSQYNACRSSRPNGVSANMAACAAEYAGCLGRNPFAGNGTNTITPAAPVDIPVTVTEIVSSFTTYCPEPTVLSVGGKTYTVTEATTLTITNCPCTLTKTSVPTINTIYTTSQVVKTVTIYCPAPTTVTVDKKTIVVTEATTLTVPVTQTITKPVNPSIPTAESYTTSERVTVFTTYCPAPTTITVDKNTYTVTSATTLTCPVTQTITKPVQATVTDQGQSSVAGNTVVVAQPTGTCPPVYISYITVTHTETVSVGVGAVAPVVPVTSSILGGCNPAHPGSCPSTYFNATSAPVAVVPTPSACVTSLFDGCNPAHTNCPNGPGTFVTVTPSTYPTSYFIGCNPAHSACNDNPGQFVTITSAPAYCAATSKPVAASAPSSSAYLCNPAHSYPAGVVCDPSARTLIYPAASTGKVTRRGGRWA